jgi:hypothetical protein
MTRELKPLQVGVMAGSQGDVFWDLAPWIVYSPGLDIGCNIYVANPTDTVKEYALMARLVRNGQILSEEVLPVFGYTWSQVEPGDFIVLKGAVRFPESDTDLMVFLVERESGEAIDSVATALVAPTASALPPAWPGALGTGGTGTDWAAMLNAIMPALMLGIVGIMLVSASRPQAEKAQSAAGRSD